MMVGGRGMARGRGRGFKLPVATVLLLAAVTGCTSATPEHGVSLAGAPEATPTATTPAPVPEPTVKLAGAKAASYTKSVRIAVKQGTLSSVKVSTKKGGDELAGAVSADGLTWVSEDPPKPALAYRAVAEVKDSTGKASTKKLKFTAASVPDSKRVGFTVTPSNGAIVGIGQPVIVRFMTPITRRAAMEKVMELSARTPGGNSVSGSWSWLNSREVHWKPNKFWTPGTKVSLAMHIAGVKAATNRYGRTDYSQTFKIGASHITRVDAATHRIKVYRDGKLVANWPTGTGKSGLETYSGTYVVLGKAAVQQMDSCSAGITCDKKDPDYYDDPEYFATRITASGTFLHAADWDGLLGQANVSHGCIHLSKINAEKFYDHAVPGDIVIVSNTGRGPQDRINTQDPGLYDWNLPTSTWKANSAL